MDIKAYDVIQIRMSGRWEDYFVVKTQEEIESTKRICENQKQLNGQSYRIVDDMGNVKFDPKA